MGIQCLTSGPIALPFGASMSCDTYLLNIYQVQVQVQNFIQKTFSGYTQVAYEKKEEQ